MLLRLHGNLCPRNAHHLLLDHRNKRIRRWRGGQKRTCWKSNSKSLSWSIDHSKKHPTPSLLSRSSKNQPSPLRSHLTRHVSTLSIFSCILLYNLLHVSLLDFTLVTAFKMYNGMAFIQYISFHRHFVLSWLFLLTVSRGTCSQHCISKTATKRLPTQVIIQTTRKGERRRLCSTSKIDGGSHFHFSIDEWDQPMTNSLHISLVLSSEFRVVRKHLFFVSHSEMKKDLRNRKWKVR